MACNAGPDIIEDGLVLCLDAGNKLSYPGTGTAWADLVGGNDGTLNNMENNFDSANKGGLVFDGANEYINCGSVPVSSAEFSVEILFKWDDYNTSDIGFLIAGANEKIELHTGGGAGTNGLRWIPYNFYQNNSTDAVIDAANIITSGLNHVVFTAKNSSTSKAYKSGSLFATSTSTGTGSFSSQTINIGRRNANQYFFDGNIYFTRIYSRALTADEVRQNYEATVGRFT